MRQQSKLTSAFLRASRDDARKDQDGKCSYCRDPISSRSATADHVVARACHGYDHRNNIVASCKPCNMLKGKLDVKTFRRMIEDPRPGEPIAFRLVNFRLRLNRRMEQMERRLGVTLIFA